MQKNTTISLGQHFDTFIREQLEAGRYSSTSEVMRAGLRLLEESEARADLAAIARHTEREWGREQRNRYLLQLDLCLHMMADSPWPGDAGWRAIHRTAGRCLENWWSFSRRPVH